MASPWVWQEKLGRYRNTVTGRFIGPKQMVALRDQFVDHQKGQMVALTNRLTAGQIDMVAWQRGMKGIIKQSFIDQYVLGKGGRNMMTAADWGRVGQMVKSQNAYLRRFAGDLADGKLSAGQAGVRAALYGGASRQAFEVAKGRSAGMPTLPQYPGDGQTVCGTNCQCSWDIQETEDGWDCTWSLGAAEHCPDCLALAEQYAPLHLDKPGA